MRSLLEGQLSCTSCIAIYFYLAFFSFRLFLSNLLMTPTTQTFRSSCIQFLT